MAVKHRPVDRRNFLRASAGAALGLPAVSYARVTGSNSILRVGFVGCGARAQAHIHLIVQMAMANKGVAPVAVCDVWDGLEEEYDHTFGGTTTRRKYSQGLYPSAKKCGLNPDDPKRATKDYRRLLDLKDVDAVCISTPDHWHARQTLDALAAGKDVFVETPLARTAADAQSVLEAAAAGNRVLTLGVQGLSDPVWRRAHDAIRGGKIGHVSHVQAGVFRNDVRGQWRFYRVVPQMTAKTVDWDLFLGHRFEVGGVPLGPTPADKPFDKAAFAQWRCDRSFSGGPFTDLLTHHATRLMAATGLRNPVRVTAAGGLFVEADGRTVPDVGTLAVDFDTAHLLLTSDTASAYPMEEVIRGRLGAIKFVRGGLQVIKDDPHGGAGLPPRLEKEVPPAEVVRVEQPRNETETLWENFLACVRNRDRNTLCGPDLGTAAVVLADLGLKSFDEGRAFGWDTERREAVPADAKWMAGRKRVG